MTWQDLKELWYDQNQSKLREQFEEFLVDECDYSPVSISEVDDGWDEWLNETRRIEKWNFFLTHWQPDEDDYIDPREFYLD